MSENFSVVGFVARHRSKKFLPVLLCHLRLEFSDLTKRHEVCRRKFSAIIGGSRNCFHSRFGGPDGNSSSADSAAFSDRIVLSKPRGRIVGLFRANASP